MPSSFMYGDPNMDSEQIVYREGHDIDAALARGKHQAVELARQCWDELADQDFPEEDIAPLVFRPWYEAVLKWATDDHKRHILVFRVRFSNDCSSSVAIGVSLLSSTSEVSLTNG